MKNRILTIHLLMLFAMISRAQQTEFIQIKDAIVDDTLTLPSDAEFYAPLYIVNRDYVVFQGRDNTRKILNADIASFRFPDLRFRDRGKCFALDRNGVYFNGIFIETDTTGFQIVDEFKSYTDYIWKTNDKVFLNTTEITEDIDVPSFHIFGRHHQKDKNHIYYMGQKIECSDGGSGVRSIIEDLVYDKNYVYYKGEIALFEGDTIRSINHISGKTEKYVISLNIKWNQSFRPDIQAQMDVKTIKPLSRYYSMDKNGVYFLSEKTPVRPQNLKNVKVWDWVNTSRVSDGITIYAQAGDADCPESDLDAKSFGVFPYSDFYFDKNGVYDRKYDDKLRKAINVKFPFVYTEAVSESNTFLAGHYIIYKNQAYDLWDKELYKNLTSEQVALIKENKLVLSQNDRQKKVFDYGFYEVDNEIFWNEKKTIADAPTFKEMTVSGYYKDTLNVYDYERETGLIPLRGIDAQTATTNAHNFLADKDYIYANNFRIIRNSDVELLTVIVGYKMVFGWTITAKSPMYYHLFRNNDGYWLVFIYDYENDVRVRSLGDSLSEDLQEILSRKQPEEMRTLIKNLQDKVKQIDISKVKIKTEY